MTENLNTKISIIIPVYGVEKYIEKCINSLLTQNFKDFEALIIDDGSLDNSISIAKRLVKNNPRFIFLHKSNGGQASARNLGLDHAKGQYIAFLDSDDYLDPNYLLYMYKKALKTNADITTCGINFVDEFNNIVKTIYSTYDSLSLENDFLISKGGVTNFMWDKLFKKELFEHLRFNTQLRTNEDVHLIFRLIYKKSISNIHTPLYYYLQRAGSTSKGVNSHYLQDRISIKNMQLQFIEEKNLGHKKRYITNSYLKTFVFYSATVFARYSKFYNSDIKELKNSIDPSLFSIKNILNLTCTDKKTGLSLLLFKISPKLFKLLVRAWFKNHIA